MADGSQKPIEDVAVGDEVLATDPQTGESGAREVTELIRHGGDHTIVDITLDDGTVIEATDEHPFWSANRGSFVFAIDLEVGDLVLGADGDLLAVAETAVYSEDLTAYNLAIEGIHTYYAGETPVLVHNTCEVDADGIAHAIDNHTVGGSALRPGAGVWDEGVDLHSLAHRTDGLQGVPQQGSHDSILFRIDAGQLIGTSGSGRATSFFEVLRDRFTNEVISMYPVAP